jgi:NitT/TauT family transport system substrate-binding protein
LVQTYYEAPDSVAQHGTFVPAAWEVYMEFLQEGEGEQKALAGPVDLLQLLTDEIAIKAWGGLDIDAAKKM